MKNILILILVFLFISCASTKIVEVPVDRIKIEYKDRTRIDTIIKQDSTIIRDRGDTTVIEKYKYLYKIKEVRDTVNLTDTITVVNRVDVIKEVNKIHNWQVILMVIGGAAIALRLYKFINRFRKWI